MIFKGLMQFIVYILSKEMRCSGGRKNKTIQFTTRRARAPPPIDFASVRSARARRNLSKKLANLHLTSCADSQLSSYSRTGTRKLNHFLPVPPPLFYIMNINNYSVINNKKSMKK